MSGPSAAVFSSFGEMLKYLRKRAQLTQRTLGIAVGYSDAQIARLENGSRQPDLVAVKTVFAEALDIQNEPELFEHLVLLATKAHGETPADLKHLGDPSQPGTTIRNGAMNLPAPLTRFIGRKREVQQLVQLLEQKRLITLTGAGGVGKTRLALEVGATFDRVMIPLKDDEHRRIQGHTSSQHVFRDGVRLVELASLNDPALIPQAVVRVFNLPEQPGRTHLEMLINHLSDKCCLLILDNCEHLVAACAEFIATLLKACPDLHVLATSREALNVSGEVIRRVPSLTTPDPSRLPPLELMRGYEAIELFVDHAAAAQPDFVLKADNASAVAQICHRLGGIPLALEMAAAQVAAMSIDEMTGALDDRFTLLASGQRATLPHHRTLRATLDWSYALLSETERLLLARLSVFAGGWTVDTAQAVCAGPLHSLNGQHVVETFGVADVLPLLLNLVRKSLVAVNVASGQAHYVLLETVRQYAEQKLHELGEMEVVRDRHLACFLALAEETMDLGGSYVDQWVRRIDLQFDNLRAAFAWASKRDDHGEAALRLAGALRTYWSYQGHLSEGMGWLNVALARGGAAPAAARARALLAQASQTRHQGELARTHSTAEASLALFRQTDDRIGLAWCLVFLANNVNEPHSQAYADEALKLFRETGSMDGISRALRALGAGAHRTGNDALAIELLEQSVVASQAAGESWDINLCLIRLYDVDPQRALKLCARELAHRRAIGNLEHVAAMLLSYGILLVSHGEFAHAQTVLDEALRWWQQPDATPRYWAFPVILLGQGFIELSMGHLEPAISWFEQSRKLHYEMGAYAVSDVALLLIASVRIAQGDLATATDVTRTCLQRFHGYGYHTGMMCSVVQLAELAHKRGDHSRAVKLLAAADVLGHEYDVTLPWATRLCSAWYQHVQLTNAKLTLAAARNQLDGAEFDASYLAGAQMTLAQSVMYALQGE